MVKHEGKYVFRVNVPSDISEDQEDCDNVLWSEDWGSDFAHALTPLWLYKDIMKPREVREGPRGWSRQRQCSQKDSVQFLKALEFGALQATWQLDCPDVDLEKWEVLTLGWYWWTKSTSEEEVEFFSNRSTLCQYGQNMMAYRPSS